jgi:hypothetical protein
MGRTIIGSYVSTYVRKVLAAMALKGLDNRIDQSRRSSAGTSSTGSRRSAARDELSGSTAIRIGLSVRRVCLNGRHHGRHLFP